jgi:SAM-dependent methyltransferase
VPVPLWNGTYRWLASTPLESPSPLPLPSVGHPIAETQKAYAAIADEYARRTGSVDAQLPNDLDFLTSHLPAEAVIADVGCGPGRDIALLRSRGFHVIGLDMSAAQLQVGGVRGVVQADMRRLPLVAAAVAAVWCRAALLHIPRDEVPGVLAEFTRVVQPGGWLYLAVAEGDGEGWETAVNYNSDHRRWFTYHREPDLTAMLDDASFRVRHVVRSRAYRSWLSVHAQRQPS